MTSNLFFDNSLSQIQEKTQEWGEPLFRARQIWEGVYQHLWNEPNQWSNLPSSLKQRLLQTYDFSGFTPIQELISSDHETIKTLFRLQDEMHIEALLMRYDNRQTVCISTQVGCPMGCTFCATGQMGFKRNLSSGEIVAQIIYFARKLKPEDLRITNVVFMGMGEPFLNYSAVIDSITRMNDPQGYNLGERRFTISTVGIVPGIRRFADYRHQVNLAVSLHAANDTLRSNLIPNNQKYSLADIINACRYYINLTNRRVTFEWALIEGVNDQPEDAKELSLLVKNLLCHVNLIQLNPTSGYSGAASSRKRAMNFKNILEDAGVPSSFRLRRGIDIQAGCGQLAVRHAKDMKDARPETRNTL